MTARITIVNGIIIAIAVQVQTVDGFGIQVGSIIEGDESAPLRAVITGVTVIQAGIIRSTIAIGTKTGSFTELYSGMLILPSFLPVVKKKPPGLPAWEAVFLIEYMEHYFCNISI